MEQSEANELRGYLDKMHPYKPDIFPTTTEQAAKRMRDAGLSDNDIGAISGCIARVGYNAALLNIEKFLDNE